MVCLVGLGDTVRLKAQLAVIPKHVPILAVGGIKPDNMRPWLDAGASGFGLGGGLYMPDQSPEETLATATSFTRTDDTVTPATARRPDSAEPERQEDQDAEDHGRGFPGLPAALLRHGAVHRSG